MRRSIVMFALCVAMFGAESAWSQRDPQTKLAFKQREQTIFKEWAKGIRETSDIAKLMQKTQAAHRGLGSEVNEG